MVDLSALPEELRLRTAALDLAVQYSIGANQIQTNGYMSRKTVIDAAEQFEQFITSGRIIQND